ncbi:hypothetical protein B0H10DRAFT_1954622 [Mycena sp. CBHHK59/15]|nr:hypothetical protein B0H10DRAFT_1954622 [Mycena sp. CBHHK59/15]
MSHPVGNLGGSRRQGTRTMSVHGLRGSMGPSTARPSGVGSSAQWVRALHPHNAIADTEFRDTLTVTAWQALGLLHDIAARKSKVLVLGLCRTPSDTPKTYYTLKEAAVVPVADLKRIFKGRSQHPGRILKEHEQIRLADGALGAMLVIGVEQAESDSRTVVEAINEVNLFFLLPFSPIQGSSFHHQISTMSFNPLGVFEMHRALPRLGQLPEAMWKACLANALLGGLFTPTFRTS